MTNTSSPTAAALVGASARRLLALVAASALCLSACSSPAEDTAAAPSSTAAPSSATATTTAASNATASAATTSEALTATPAAVADRGDCTDEAVSRDLGRAYHHVSDCDGKWGYAALVVKEPYGDTTIVIHFRDGKWEKLTSIPVSDPELCEENLRAQGMPEHFFGVGVFGRCPSTQQESNTAQGQGPSNNQAAIPGQVPNSDVGFYRPWWGYNAVGSAWTWEMGSNGQPVLGLAENGEVSAVALSNGIVATEQYPKCEGRGIVIVDSFIETPGADNQQGLARMMDAHPGAAFLRPGYCASLRGMVDGKRVYPIYYDFGYNHADLCDGKAKLGGNARLLSKYANFRDPCL